MARRSARELPLNSQSIQAAEAIEERKTEYRIRGERGLLLIVLPGGTATYFFRYAVKIGQRRKFRTLKLGRRDGLTLHDARRKCADHRRTVENGGDPVGELKARTKAMTFRQLAEERLKTDASLKKSTKELHRSLFRHHVYPELGEIPADDVNPDMVSALLNKIEARSRSQTNKDGGGQADKARSLISALYSWGRGRRLTKANPTLGLAKRGTSVPRKRVLTDDELVKLWNFLGSTETDLSPAIRRIIRLAVLTGQRRTEVAGARVSEFDLDGDSPTWTIPGDKKVSGELVRGRTKNGETQTVPLSHQAAELWREAIKEAGKSEYVFPADVSRSKIGGTTRVLHINGESVSKAMRRIRRQLGIEDITVHDLRRTMATRLGDRDHRSEVIARLLNHKPRDITGTTYNHSRYVEQARRAFQDWANYVDEKVRGETTSNVVSFTGAAMA